MNKLREWILAHRKLVVAVFLAAAVLCTVLWPFVQVNYNMVDYLPEGAQSTEALALMEQEFPGGIPGTRVMVRDVSVQEALAYKEQLEQIEGVASVMWLDDVADLKTPLEVQDAALTESYYRDGTALFSVAIEEKMEAEAVEGIYNVIGEDNAAAGDAVTTAASQTMAFSECMRAILILVPIILLILILSTDSWLEPVLFLAAIGVAVLINMGTNVFFGEISFVTQAVSPILQLAVSLDYAIFLLHSFERHRKTCASETEAMKLAMKESFTSIAASAATTLFGFLALVFMKFRIGSDLGINLAKGILLSFLSVMLFLPALTLCFCRWIDRTKHRPLLPKGKTIGKTILKLRIPVGAAALILLVPCFLAQSRTSFTYGMGTMPDSIRCGRDERMIAEVFGESNPIVVLVPRGEPAKEKVLTEALGGLERVESVMSYAGAAGTAIPPEYLPESVTNQFYSEHYSRLIVYGSTQSEGDEAFRLVEQVRNEAETLYGAGNTWTCGMSVNLYDMKNTVESDNSLVNLLAVISIGLVLLVTFRSLTLPLLLLLTIETAIFINLAVPYFTGSSLCYIGYLVINTVQLGATVDYAILLTDTYRSSRRQLKAREAMEKTIGSVFFSILISAAIMTAAGICLWLTSTNPIVSALGLLLGRGTILSMVLVVGFLPGMLILFDKLIWKTTWKGGA